jgi:hypothetical protein
VKTTEEAPGRMRPEGAFFPESEMMIYNTVTYSRVLFTMELYCTPKTQHTTVNYNQ